MKPSLHNPPAPEPISPAIRRRSFTRGSAARGMADLLRLLRELEPVRGREDWLKSAFKALRRGAGVLSEIRIGLKRSSGHQFTVFASADDSGAGDVALTDLLPEHRSRLMSRRGSPVVLSAGPKTRIFSTGRPGIAVRRHVLFPLERAGELLGFAWIGSPDDNAFEPSGVRTIDRLSRVLSASLLGVVHQSSQESRLRLSALASSIEAKRPSDSPPDRIGQCLEGFLECSGAERASLMLFDPDSGSLSVTAVRGLSVLPIAGLKLEWGEGIAGFCLKERRILSIADLSAVKSRGKNGGHPRGKKNGERDVRTLTCVPLYANDRPVGVVNLSTLSCVKPPDAVEVQHLNRLAEHFGRLLFERPLLASSLRTATAPPALKAVSAAPGELPAPVRTL